ncbi:MAG: O-antigen ligase family protein [Patescibacteria group bacterium]
MKLNSQLKKTIVWLFSSLFFFVPLFFTSVNSELFEFNKIILTYGFTTLIVGAWAARMIIQKKLLFKRTPLDIPLIVFLVSQLLSLVFSMDRHTSFWGYYSRFNGGILSLVAYCFLYWAFVSNCEAKDVFKVLKTSLFSALIVSIYGILEHFGHSFSCLMFTGNFDVGCWVQDVRNRVFASLGQPNWLATYLTTLLPATLALNLAKPKNNQVLSYLLFVLLTMCLIFTGSRSGFLGFAAAIGVFWGVLYIKKIKGNEGKKTLKPLGISLALILGCLVIFGSPFDQLNRLLHYKSWMAKISPSPSQTQQETSDQTVAFISESGDIRKIVWKGAIEIFKHYPLFGSGVETFAYSYYNFRPLEHNHVSEWDFLYNKAHNEYLNYLSTTGAVGFGAYAFLIIFFIVWSIRELIAYIFKTKDPEQNQDQVILSLALFSGWLSILISNFFGFSVVVVSLYFYLIPAFIFVLNRPDTPSAKIEYSTSKLPLLILGLVVSYLLYSVFNLWQADYHYAQGLKQAKQGEYTLSYQSMSKAIRLSPDEPVFLNDLSVTAANLSILAATQKEATLAAELFQNAISFSNKALKISPYNLNIHKNRVKVFYSLASIDPEYLEKAIEAVKTAMKLAPTDPKLVYNLGLLYGRTEKVEEALATIHKAIEMKPNYEEARNALATFYEDLGRKQEALEQLEYILQTKKNDPSLLERIELLKK